MKSTILISTIVLFFTISCNAQSSDQEAIKETIMTFSKAGDVNDPDKLATCLDENYRVVMNRLFGSTEVAIMTKDVYLEKIRTKEYGGDTRTVKIGPITLNGTTASTKVSFEGTKMTFVSILTLVRDGDNQWKIIGDLPVLK